MSAGFEGSFLGDNAKLADDTKLEYGICWYVYGHKAARAVAIEALNLVRTRPTSDCRAFLKGRSNAA